MKGCFTPNDKMLSRVDVIVRIFLLPPITCLHEVILLSAHFKYKVIIVHLVNTFIYVEHSC